MGKYFGKFRFSTKNGDQSTGVAINYRKGIVYSVNHNGIIQCISRGGGL